MILRRRKENHFFKVYWREFEVNQEEIEALMNIYQYNNFEQEMMKIIDRYGPTNVVLICPYLLAKGPNNELIACNNSTKQLVVFDEHFQYSHDIRGVGSGNGSFQCVTGIAVDKKRNLYVADSIYLFPSLELRVTKDGEFQFPDGLVLSQSEHLFVCDSHNHRIQVFQN